MKKISLIFKDDADANAWMEAANSQSMKTLLAFTNIASAIKVSTRKGKAKAAINKATL